LLVSFGLAALGSPVLADPMTTFTVTDLGTGTPTFGTGANGGIVVAGNGQTAYPFPMAQDTALSQPGLLSSQFPIVAAAPVNDPSAYGSPTNAYSTPLSAITNGQGTFVAIDAYGVYGHMGEAVVYSVSRNADGTWDAPTTLWSGGEQSSGTPQPGQASITGINSLGQVLGTGTLQAVTGSTGLVQPYLYDPNTHSLLDLYSLNVLQAGGWSNLQPIAIDDQGRILLEASANPTSGDRSAHTLLLIPQGASSDPVAAPEPGALALAIVMIATLTLRRALHGRA
jgi:hypothetical protein